MTDAPTDAVAPPRRGHTAFNTILGTVYDLGAEVRPIARAGAWFEWGASLTPMYESMRAVAEVPDGGTILDLPCGGGPVFRELRPEQRVRYIAADYSTTMLDRARRRARRRLGDRAELLQTDAGDIRLPDDTADLVVTYNGLQCFPDAARAVQEMARVLRPGGRIVGTTVLSGIRPWHDRIIRGYQRAEAFGPGGTQDDLARWLSDAGFEEIAIDRSGALARFSAVNGAR